MPIVKPSPDCGPRLGAVPDNRFLIGSMTAMAGAAVAASTVASAPVTAPIAIIGGIMAGAGAATAVSK